MMLMPGAADAYCVVDPAGRAGALPMLAERDPRGALRIIDRRLAARPSADDAGWLWASAAIAQALLDRPEQTHEAARRGLAAIAGHPDASSRWQLIALEAGTSEDEPAARAGIARMQRARRAIAPHSAAAACLLDAIGRLQLVLPESRTATASINTAYRIVARPGSEVERAWITLMLSILMVRSDEPDAALSFLDEGLALARSRTLRMTLANIQYARGKALIARRDYAGANTAFAESAALARRWQGPESAAFAEMGLCQTQLELGHLARADVLCARAAGPLAQSQSIKALHLLQARIAARRGRRHLAFRHLAAVLDGKHESMTGSTQTAALRERARLRAAGGDFRGAYDDLARHLAQVQARNTEALHRQTAMLRARLAMDRRDGQNAMLRAELVRVAEHDRHRSRIVMLSSIATAAIIALLAYTLILGRRHRRQLQRLVDTDALTGLPNRRAIHRAAVTIHQAAAASVVMLDIDHFKRLNDRHGHAAGDAALIAFAAAARATLRPDDLIGRWGGEEFVAVLPATDIATATAVIERLRRTAAAIVLPEAPGVRLTFSAGIAAWHPERSGPDHALAAADAAMYRAKDTGRDRTIIHTDPAESAGDRPSPHRPPAKRMAAAG